MIGNCREGRGLAMEMRLRTATRNAAPTSSGGTVSSRKATNSVTRRNRLTATLRIESSARRLLRRAFLRMKVPRVTENKLQTSKSTLTQEMLPKIRERQRIRKMRVQPELIFVVL